MLDASLCQVASLYRTGRHLKPLMECLELTIGGGVYGGAKGTALDVKLVAGEGLVELNLGVAGDIALRVDNVDSVRGRKVPLVDAWKKWFVFCGERNQREVKTKAEEGEKERKGE